MSPVPESVLRSVAGPAWPARRRSLVLSLCIACGLLVPAYFLGVAEVSHLAWDFRAYYTAAAAALRGAPFVGIDAGLPGVSYVYPPVSVLLFVPQAAVGGWRLAFALQTVLNVLAALALAGLVLATIESRRGRLPTRERLLVAGFCLGTPPVVAVVGLGQVDTLIALALAGAFLALEGDRQGVAGAALAGAALVKVFPVVLGLWLAWRRAWRALGVAVFTGTGGLAAGALWFGLDAYRRYLDVLAGRSRVAEFAGTVSPNFFAMSLYRPLSQFLPTADPHLYAPLALVALAPVLAFVGGDTRTFADRLATYLVALVAMLLVSPASNALYVVYVYFPVLCLLYLDATRREQPLLLFGAAALALPVQPAQVRAVLEAVDAPQFVAANALFAVREVLTVASVPLIGLLVVLGWCALHRTRRNRRTAVDVGPAHAD
jgi:hypothetical protein